VRLQVTLALWVAVGVAKLVWLLDRLVLPVAVRVLDVDWEAVKDALSERVVDAVRLRHVRLMVWVGTRVGEGEGLWERLWVPGDKLRELTDREPLGLRTMDMEGELVHVEVATGVSVPVNVADQEGGVPL